MLAVGKEIISNTTPNTASETYVTAGVQGDVDKAVTAAQSATSIAELDAAYAILNVPAADIDPNAVYRIGNINVDADKTKYASTTDVYVGKDGTLAAAYNSNNTMNRSVSRVASTADFIPQLWQFEANADGTYKIKAANVGAYWGNKGPIDLPVSKENSGDFTIKSFPGQTINNGKTNDPTTMFQILQGGTIRMNALSGWQGTTIGSYGENHDGDAGNYWQIEKVSTIPVVIGETGYASVGYPFAVQVPAESGVEAFYGKKAEGGVLTLAKIEDGIIPANTGAILYKEGGASVPLTITTTAKTITDNVLSAATAKRVGFSENENYLLAKDADNKVKFLQVTITTVPANKAFLSSANVGSTANTLVFSFESETDGISGVEAAKSSATIYDLSGRCVKNAQKGIFIVNGKKVIK